MKTLQFEAIVARDGSLQVPSHLATELAPDQTVRVILVVPEVEDDGAWTVLSAEQFLRGYTDGDAIYDDLPAR